MATTFIGIDLAWKTEKNHTGMAVLREANSGVELISYSHDMFSSQGIEAYLSDYVTDNTVVAIDAPLIIANTSGQRECERAVSQEFGSREASAHSSNLSNASITSPNFAKKLATLGFEHGAIPEVARRQSGRWMFEGYPHAAQVVLFDLKRTIKYKKGNIAQKRMGLEELRTLIRTKLTASEPALRRNDMLLALLDQDIEQLKGTALKQYEDTLDAVICAFLAAYYWWWGIERNKCIGNVRSGYIINPTYAL